jgi:cytochrome c-type biogenesis protein CcmF
MRIANTPWMALLFLVCMFAFVGNAWKGIEIFRKSRLAIGGFVAHVGIATLFAGLILSRGFEQKELVYVRAGVPETKALDYQIRYAGMTSQDLYDRDAKAKFEMVSPTGEKFTATPGLYWQHGDDGGEDKPMTWPFILHYASHDVYVALGAPVVTVWEKPVWFHEGETKTLSGITVTYSGMKMTGEPGTSSAVFGAALHVSDEKGEWDVTPHFSVANGPDLPQFNSELRVAVTRIDAADKSAEIQMFFSSPIYPIELFTKPLTAFVWAGTGIMTVGSLIAAYSRRRKVTSESG